MRGALPTAIATLFCVSCVVFIRGDDDTARVFGTPDTWSIHDALGYPVLFVQPWVLLASLFRENWFPAVIVIECAAAVLFALLLGWLRRWRTAYRVAAVFITTLSFLLLFDGWRMHAAAARAEREYGETSAP